MYFMTVQRILYKLTGRLSHSMDQLLQHDSLELIIPFRRFSAYNTIYIRWSHQLKVFNLLFMREQICSNS